MSRQTMETLRRRSKALGLVEVREEDKEAFQATGVHFRKAAHDIERD